LCLSDSFFGLEGNDIQFGSREDDTNRYIMVRHNFMGSRLSPSKRRKPRWVDLGRDLRPVSVELRGRRTFEPEGISIQDFMHYLQAAGLRRMSFHAPRHIFASL